MNIPEKAIEAAAEAMWKISPYGWRGIGDPPPFESAPPRAKETHRKRSRAALESAAPFIAAHALNDAATYIEDWSKAGADDPISPDETATWLRTRASLIAIESEAPNA